MTNDKGYVFYHAGTPYVELKMYEKLKKEIKELERHCELCSDQGAEYHMLCRQVDEEEGYNKALDDIEEYLKKTWFRQISKANWSELKKKLKKGDDMEIENRLSLVKTHLETLIEEIPAYSDMEKLVEARDIVQKVRWSLRRNKEWKKSKGKKK